MTEIYAGFVADHTFDHLRLRTTRILCREEHTKAVNPDAKNPKSQPNHTNNQVCSVWELGQAGSTPVIPTIGLWKATSEALFFGYSDASFEG